MSTFQGFNVTGIDRNKYPVILDDKIDDKKIYLALEPIEFCADVETQKVWGHFFRYMVENWVQFIDFHHYQETVKAALQLEFVSQDNEFFICAYGIDLSSLLGSVSFIQALVNETNQSCIEKIKSIESERQHIDHFNSRHFSDVIDL